MFLLKVVFAIQLVWGVVISSTNIRGCSIMVVCCSNNVVTSCFGSMLLWGSLTVNPIAIRKLWGIPDVLHQWMQRYIVTMLYMCMAECGRILGEMVHGLVQYCCNRNLKEMSSKFWYNAQSIFLPLFHNQAQTSYCALNVCFFYDYKVPTSLYHIFGQKLMFTFSKCSCT